MIAINQESLITNLNHDTVGFRPNLSRTAMIRNMKSLIELIDDRIIKNKYGVYKFNTTSMRIGFDIIVADYPLCNVEDIYKVSSFLVINFPKRDGNEFILLIPENDKEFENIEYDVLFF